MSKSNWVLAIVVALVLGTLVVGVWPPVARADTSATAGATAVLGNSMTWSVITAPLTKDGDIVGYNVYVFQEKTGMLWAWQHGSEIGLLRIPTRDQYERGGTLADPGRAKDRGTTY